MSVTAAPRRLLPAAVPHPFRAAALPHDGGFGDDGAASPGGEVGGDGAAAVCPPPTALPFHPAVPQPPAPPPPPPAVFGDAAGSFGRHDCSSAMRASHSFDSAAASRSASTCCGEFPSMPRQSRLPQLTNNPASAQPSHTRTHCTANLNVRTRHLEEGYPTRLGFRPLRKGHLENLSLVRESAEKGVEALLHQLPQGAHFLLRRRLGAAEARHLKNGERSGLML